MPFMARRKASKNFYHRQPVPPSRPKGGQNKSGVCSTLTTRLPRRWPTELSMCNIDALFAQWGQDDAKSPDHSGHNRPRRPRMIFYRRHQRCCTASPTFTT